MFSRPGNSQNRNFGNRPPVGNGDRKQPCKYYAEGTCRKGNACLFSHGQNGGMQQGSGNWGSNQRAEQNSNRFNSFHQEQNSTFNNANRFGQNSNQNNNNKSQTIFGQSSQVSQIRNPFATGSLNFNSNVSLPSKPQNVPMQRPQEQNSSNQARVCKYFASGNCHKGNACEFSHSAPSQNHPTNNRGPNNSTFNMFGALARGENMSSVFSAPTASFSGHPSQFNQMSNFRTSAQSGFGQSHHHSSMPNQMNFTISNSNSNLADAFASLSGDNSAATSPDLDMTTDDDSAGGMNTEAPISSQIVRSSSSMSQANYDTFVFGKIPITPPPEIF